MSIKTNQIEPKPRHIESSTPAHLAGHGIAYPREVNGVVEFFFKDSDGTETQITEQGSLRLPTSPALVPAGGTENSMLTKNSNTDHEMVWTKIASLMNEFYFVLPAAANIDQRIAAMTAVPGLELYSGDNDPSNSSEFGVLPSTLVIDPNGLSGIIVGEVAVMQKTTTGADDLQGWSKLGSDVDYKSDLALTKAAFINFGSQIDIAKDVFVRIRFFKTTMP